jgi:hypothetical protein
MMRIGSVPRQKLHNEGLAKILEQGHFDMVSITNSGNGDTPCSYDNLS